MTSADEIPRVPVSPPAARREPNATSWVSDRLLTLCHEKVAALPDFGDRGWSTEFTRSYTPAVKTDLLLIPMGARWAAS